MLQLSSIPYLIYQSIMEFALVLPPSFPHRLGFTFSLQVSAAALHSFLCSTSPLSFTTHRLARSYRLLAYFRFSSQLHKNATETRPIHQSLIVTPFSSSSSPPLPLLQMMHTLRGEHFHPNRLTVSNKEDRSESQEKGTGRFTSGGITEHFQCPHLIPL